MMEQVERAVRINLNHTMGVRILNGIGTDVTDEVLNYIFGEFKEYLEAKIKQIEKIMQEAMLTSDMHTVGMIQRILKILKE